MHACGAAQKALSGADSCNSSLPLGPSYLGGAQRDSAEASSLCYPKPAAWGTDLAQYCPKGCTVSREVGMLACWCLINSGEHIAPKGIYLFTYVTNQGLPTFTMTESRA